MFYYVYALRSQRDNKLYVGFTANLEHRLSQHSKGEVTATRSRRPLDLIFYEAYRNKYDALRREKYFKTANGKSSLHRMLKEFFLNPGHQ